MFPDFGAPPFCDPPTASFPSRPSARAGVGCPIGRARDIVLPLDVTLEELYAGANRRVVVNQSHLSRAKQNVPEDVFDVPVPPGAPDGHRVAFPGQANGDAPGTVPGDLVFVLQERRHPNWRRRGNDLYIERTISLLEALTGFRLTIEHLDGRKLTVSSRPGEIVRPRNLLPNPEADWERFDNTDAFPGQDAASLRTDDLEACKEVCRQKGFSGFTYWEDTAYFRTQARGDLLTARQSSKGSALFVRPDPAKSRAMRVQRAIRGAGMPVFGDPSSRGNLFLLLKVRLPDKVDDRAAELLREVLPPGPIPPLSDEDRDLEELELCDLDPRESQRRHHIATGGVSTAVDDRDEAPPAGSPGPPPPGCSLM